MSSPKVGSARRDAAPARGQATAGLAFVGVVAYGAQMNEHRAATQTVTSEPSHVPSGAALLALELSEIARGIRGLDVLRRSVDRAPPSCI